MLENPQKSNYEYEKLGKEHLTENVFQKELSDKRERGYEKFEERFGMPGTVYLRTLEKVEGDEQGAPYEIKRLAGKIDGSDIDITYAEDTNGEIRKMKGNINNVDIQDLLGSLGSHEKERLDMIKKISNLVKEYSKYSRIGEHEDFNIERAKKLSAANALIYKMEKGLELFDEKRKQGTSM